MAAMPSRRSLWRSPVSTVIDASRLGGAVPPRRLVYGLGLVEAFGLPNRACGSNREDHTSHSKTLDRSPPHRLVGLGRSPVSTRR